MFAHLKQSYLPLGRVLLSDICYCPHCEVQAAVTIECFFTYELPKSATVTKRQLNHCKSTPFVSSALRTLELRCTLRFLLRKHMVNYCLICNKSWIWRVQLFSANGMKCNDINRVTFVSALILRHISCMK